MSNRTITVKPLPSGTDEQKIKQIFHAYSVERIHIVDEVAYVEFNNESDLEMLEMTFQDYKVGELNNAEIDKPENFDWSALGNESKHSSNSSSDKAEDLSSAERKNLVLITNCDSSLVQSKTESDIKKIFGEFSSANRVVKRQNEVIVEFLNANDIDLLEMKFENNNCPELGQQSQIVKPEESKVDPTEFSEEYSKIAQQQSALTQATEQMQQEEKPSNSSLEGNSVPPFDKKTSMEVDFLNEQSKFGKIQEEPSSKIGYGEPIEEADTKQELNFPSETQIPEQAKTESKNDQFGYQAAQKQNENQTNSLGYGDQSKQNAELGYKNESGEANHEESPKGEMNVGYDNTQEKQEQPSKNESNLGYGDNSSANLMDEAKSAAENVQKSMQENLGYAVNQAKQGSSDLLEKALNEVKKSDDWNVRPSVEVPRPVSGSVKKVSKTLVTVSLFAWVVFLLIQ